jgi:poly(hydroxyalkanoate) depolymerase family esterase
MFCKMKYGNLFFLLCCFFLLGFHAQAQQELTRIANFGNNPGRLSMYTYVPDSVKGKPLVVVLHGCSETATTCARLTDWNKWANMYGFAVLYPEQQITNNPSNCFNWFEQGDQQRNVGEPASIAAMIQKMYELYLVDTSRIFISGLSAGAAMASIMMSVYPEKFVAGALFAGGPYRAAENVLQARKAMKGQISKTPEAWGNLVRAQHQQPVKSFPRLAVFQGTEDRIVHPNNADALISQWRNLQTDSLTVWTSDSLFGKPNIKRTVYLDSVGTYRMVRYDIRNMGHAIAIDSGTCPCQSGKAGAWAKDRDFNAVFAALDFFGLIPEATNNPIVMNESAALDRYLFYVATIKGSTYYWIISSGDVDRGDHRSSMYGVTNHQPFTVELLETDANGCALPIRRYRLKRD